MKIVAVDIGGTHARFAIAQLVSGARPRFQRVFRYRTSDHADLVATWRHFAQEADEALPPAASIAVAAPIGETIARFVNSSWAIDTRTLKQDLGVDALTLLNDFGAVAHAISLLRPDELLHVQGPEGALPDEGVTTVMGAGTGLGVAMLLRRDRQCHVIETEGGHTAFAPLDAEEFAIAEHLRKQFGRVSIERVASGMGLANLAGAIAAIEARSGDTRDLAALWQRALNGEDPVAARALDRFVATLGSAAGDLALVQGANALVLTGALVNRLADRLRSPLFVDRFRAKGRYVQRMERIAVKIATHAEPGLLGAAVAFQRAHMEA